jgi:integrase/recombinase XerD
VTVYGKGGKTRVVLLPSAVWKELLSIKEGGATPDWPVFVSRTREGFLTSTQVRRLVYQAQSQHRHCWRSHRGLFRSSPCRE